MVDNQTQLDENLTYTYYIEELTNSLWMSEIDLIRFIKKSENAKIKLVS
jgi:hypothetical protein